MKKILIANRGEIARRVIRACKTMGFQSVAVYSDADVNSLYVLEADEAVAIGAAPVQKSYLNIDALLEAAVKTGADAIHPGYGFLSENSEFAKRCEEAGIQFIGPRSEVIAQMGSKIAARQLAREAGVPVVPGSHTEVMTAEQAVLVARDLGFPVLLKASAGGGGIGMVIAQSEDELQQSFDNAKKRVTQYFGDGSMYLEKYFPNPRHIEIQILADEHDHVIHLGERECSIQRRHQKVIEESPSVAISQELRDQMGHAAIALAKLLHYTGVGTVEFILTGENEFYFLEMNTRLQVEHPVTEEVYGIDLVEWQFRVAMGEPLWSELETLKPKTHAIECRLYAEDSVRMMPSPGKLQRFSPPLSVGVRLELGVQEGDQVTPFYDPMIGKIIAAGESREAARELMLKALHEFEVEGIHTNLPLLVRILESEPFQKGETHTGFIEQYILEKRGR